ncbi:CxC2 domain-containing protein [Mycena venus]|uniref:CxC2 domain-containing protein n=1 Tax=Mycena venus TaxID=2733690 RepID=A0A8H6Y7Q3_9AGAR|nr:CxC2 domain-containing protein [Mycena venus]
MGFLVLAETGPQALRMIFCGHRKSSGKLSDRVCQLLAARLFPCGFAENRSAITFGALRRFEIEHVESKVAAYNYCGALRRMSDNSFMMSAPDMYENFIRCSHMWVYIKTLKRMGQAHGINRSLTHHPAGNTVLYCPSCLELGFNVDKKLRVLPDYLRHLNQQRDTIDGNFHCTKSKKNSDPKDSSLYKALGFFPTNAELNEQLVKIFRLSTCNYLKAVNKQDKKKFKNMKITGIVNIQCSHVFIKASVDLQHGERYANIDLALAHAIRQKLASKYEGDVEFKLEFDSVHQLILYNAACQYSVNVVERFNKNPDFDDLENCVYNFGASYMLATGHFHGEMAEVYWPDLNQIGRQVTQQSGGHQQDTIMLHHNDWNYKKTIKAFTPLLEDLHKADATFDKHHKNYLGLCATFSERIITEKLQEKSRKPDRLDRKFTKSVYRHASVKVPTQKKIYERMLADEAAIPNSGGSRLNKVVAIINDGLLIKEDQLKVQKLVARLKNAIVKRWKSQKILTPALEDRLEQQTACPVEEEMLGLPSELTPDMWEQLNVSVFVTAEVVAKTLLTLRDRKKNSSSVYKNTIAQKQINDVEHRWDLHIARYMVSQGALIALKRGEEGDYPKLEAKDTFMKS